MHTTTTETQPSTAELSHRQGAALVLFAGVVFSFGGLAFRSTSTASAWEYLTMRGLGMLAITLVVFVVQNRHRLVEVRSRFAPIHMFIGVLLAAMNALFIVSREHTTVAFVLFMQPASPIAAAYFTWLFTKERVSRNVVVSTIVTIIGVTIMVSGSILQDLSLAGLITLAIPVMFGFYTTVVRTSDKIDPSVPLITAGVVLVMAGVIFVLIDGGYTISQGDALIGLFAGSLLLGLPLAVFNRAQRVVSSPEATLLLMIEVLLAPVWVWLFADESVEVTTLIGGAFILGAVVWLTVRRGPRPGRVFSSRG